MKGKSTRQMYERYVADIDVAQDLVACGFAYPTMFFWVANAQLDTLTLHRAEEEYYGLPQYKYPAPTASEIKEHYPEEVWITLATKSLLRRQGLFYFTRYKSLHQVSLMAKSDQTDMLYEVHREEDTNEANAVGRMFVYLYENKMIV